MLRKFDTFYLSIKEYLLPYLPSSMRRTATGICTLSITPNELQWIYAVKKENKMEILFAESFPYQSHEDLVAVIHSTVKYHELNNVAARWILQPGEYQLVVTESLPVTDAEFQTAIRFKMKDLLHYPLDNVLIDSFPIPPTRAETTPKIMVVATALNKTVQTSALIREEGLNLNVIDIPELSIRNITALFEKETEAIGLVYIQDKNTQLFITAQKQLYIVRNLMFTIGDEKTNETLLEEDVGRLATEIQRSFNYYQSQWRQVPPQTLFFVSKKGFHQKIIELLSQQLKLSVNILDLSAFLSSKIPLTNELYGKFLPQLGSLFRETD